MESLYFNGCWQCWQLFYSSLSLCRGVCVFDSLNTKQWQTVLLAMEKRHCSAGEVVLHQVSVVNQRLSELEQMIAASLNVFHQATAWCCMVLLKYVSMNHTTVVDPNELIVTHVMRFGFNMPA